MHYNKQKLKFNNCKENKKIIILQTENQIIKNKH